ncbi:hypothetical protein FRC02_011499 [Tulasnella sp. 418]|nr:hypothetical protein FRC02_011499 [Tulasnella sp. 418]
MPSIPFLPLNFLPRASSPLPSTIVYESEYSSEAEDSGSSRKRRSTAGLTSLSTSASAHILPLSTAPSATCTPLPSRPASPQPLSTYSSSNSDDDDLPSPRLLGSSPLLGSYAAPRRRRWFRRRRRDSGLRGWGRTLQRIIKHPLFPTQPLTILLTLLLFTTFALLLTLFLIYALNPDKYALPWRQYCASQSSFSHANITHLAPAGVYLGVFSMDAAVERRMLVRTTWASHYRSRGVDGSTDRTIVRFVLGKPRKEWERRIQLEMQTYNDIVILPIQENMNNGKTHAFFTWAHTNAFVPPVADDETVPSPHRPHFPLPPVISEITLSTTSSTASSITQPASSDPDATTTTSEVPEPTLPYPITTTSVAAIPHPPHTAPAPILAPHDPQPRRSSQPAKLHSRSHSNRVGLNRHSQAYGAPATWVKPDYVIKADDDSFIMLAELEARLRVEWAEAVKDELKEGRDGKNPLIFWGYLVKNRFMAGEMYALSNSLVEYVATTPFIKSLARGAEDKQTAKWMRLHPEADRIRWRSEHCWIYDHPRSGTVYSHGFLFPSEVNRVKQQVAEYNATHWVTSSSSSSSATGSINDERVLLQPSPPWKPGAPDPSLPMPPASHFFSRSTVSKFGTRYMLPYSNLTTEMEVEALVEGSPMSQLRNWDEDGKSGSGSDASISWGVVERAWEGRETYEERYLVDPATNDGSIPSVGLGGTIVVHFIKKNEWFLESASALLGFATRPTIPIEQRPSRWQTIKMASKGKVGAKGGVLRPLGGADVGHEQENEEVEGVKEDEEGVVPPPSLPFPIDPALESSTDKSESTTP